MDKKRLADLRRGSVPANVYSFLSSEMGSERRGSLPPDVKFDELEPLYSPRRVELYLVRVNPICRAVWVYILQHDIPHVLIDVDFTKGDKQLPERLRHVPHREVPILLDGDVIVYDGQAILRYLGQNYTSFAGFGMTLQKQMICESIISWSSSELHRAIGYSYIYPQFLEKYSLSPETANEALVESGLRQLSRHLEIIETRYLEKNKYLTGDRITVADSFVAAIIVLLEWTGFKFTIWPKVDKWLSRVKQQDYWDAVHVTHNNFVKELQRAHVILD